jgi:hypothetical protein
MAEEIVDISESRFRFGAKTRPGDKNNGTE